MAETDPRTFLANAKKAVYEGVDAVIDVNRQRCKLVFALSQSRVPVDHGDLQSTGKVVETKTGATITYTSPYAVKLEFSEKIQRKTGQRFFLTGSMSEQVEATGADWQAAFLGALERNAQGG